MYLKGTAMTIVLVSGGFDPLHSGHIAYFKAAKELGDRLIVGVNSDEWLQRKKGKNFLPFNERTALIRELSTVDEVWGFLDRDNTACDLIERTLKEFPNYTICFANGGDRGSSNIPELDKFMDNDRVIFRFSVGGDDKKNSSSKILKEWKEQVVHRPWGTYQEIAKGPAYLVKELIVNPNSAMSMQRHKQRSEHWVVVEGKIFVNTINKSSDLERQNVLVSGQSCYIPKEHWHQMENPTPSPAKIIETWIGEELSEKDIVRK